VVVSAIELLDAGGAPQGVAGSEMANVDPLLGDSTRGLLEDLVVHDISAALPGVQPQPLGP
jgi:hypothetical protein